MPPKYQVCYVCGREFGSQSLPIHQKQCLQKREKEQANLPPNLRTSLTYDPASGEQASDAWKRSLIPCGNCGRTFLPDRLEVHAKSCKGGGKVSQAPGASYSTTSMVRPPSSSSTSPAASYNPAPYGKPPQQQIDSAPKRVQSGAGYNIITGASQIHQPPYQQNTNGSSRGIPQQQYAAQLDQYMQQQPQQTQQPQPARQQQRVQFQQPVQEQPPPNRGGKPPAGRGGRGVPFAVNVGPTATCRVCGRSFSEDRIEKHESICRGTTNHKRKVFDSSKARKKGTELESFKTKGGGASRAPPKGAIKMKAQPKWRAEHEEFIRNIREARKITQLQKVGGVQALANLPPPPPSYNPDYVDCPHCHRRFNETAAERHIPKCKDTIHKPKPPPARTLPPRAQATPTRSAMGAGAGGGRGAPHAQVAPTRSTMGAGAGAAIETPSYSGFDSWKDSAYPPQPQQTQQQTYQQTQQRTQQNGYSVRQPTPTRTNNTTTTNNTTHNIRQPTPTRTTPQNGYNVRQPTPTRTTHNPTTTNNPTNSIRQPTPTRTRSVSTPRGSTSSATTKTLQQQQPTTLTRKNSFSNIDTQPTNKTNQQTTRQQPTTLARKNSFGSMDSMYTTQQPQQPTTTKTLLQQQPTTTKLSQQQTQQQPTTLTRKNSYNNMESLYGSAQQQQQQQTTTNNPTKQQNSIYGTLQQPQRGAAGMGPAGTGIGPGGILPAGGLPPSGRPKSMNNVSFAPSIGSGSDEDFYNGFTNYGIQQPTVITVRAKTGAVGAAGVGAAARPPKFCGHCGTSFNEKAKFCMECGGPRL